jgi:ABC-type phosphate transport system permease subunit
METQAAMPDRKEKPGKMRYLPDEKTFKQRLALRNRRGIISQILYYTSIAVALLTLIALFGNVINQAFGAIATTFEVDPDRLAGEGRTLATLNEAELTAILIEHSGNRLPVLIRDHLSQVDNELYTESTLREVIPNGVYPEGYADSTINEIRALENVTEIMAQVLQLNLSRADLENLILEEVAKLQIVAAWKLSDSLFNWTPNASEQQRLDAIPTEIAALEAQITELQSNDAENNAAISDLNTQIAAKQAEMENIINSNISTVHAAQFPDTELTRFHSWLDIGFLQAKMSSIAAQSGIRAAILGSVYMMVIVIVIALPIGVGAALYLEEYATDSFFNRFIETNVRNLAGVPSIIYGLLGLAIFVRILAPITSGIFIGYGAEVPTDDRISQQIEAAVPVDILLDDEGMFTGIAENDALTAQQVQNLISVFRKYGTAGVNNMRGEIDTATAHREVRNALGINRTIETTDTAAVLDLGETSITVAQYNALVAELQRIATFTVVGRTLLSAALTLALLILPIIIINAQEALRAVPYMLREASYGLGATKWQTIWRTVLPAAVPGIMTGTILSISRAIGESAPLIVVGASTFLLTDPNSLFAKFTVLPIQVYQWTARPQGQFTASPQAQFQFTAAAAIIVLLLLVIALNTVAIILRNRYSNRY